MVLAMTKITIVAENPGSANTRFRASTRNQESVGPTIGAALDSLSAQLDKSSAGTLVLVQNLRPDEFFSAAQHSRLSDLFEKWRTARQAGQKLSQEEQAELESLVDAELEASSKRAESIAQELRS